jgi:hypothetical protein
MNRKALSWIKVLEIPDHDQLALLLLTFGEETQHMKAKQNHPHGFVAKESEGGGSHDAHQDPALKDFETSH